MNSTEDQNIAACSFSEEVVAYLYNELNASKRTTFESHLVDCDPCTAELADVSFARLDVYEWHRDEFVEMPTPRIVIPYGEAATTSWIDALRGFFASPARLATLGSAFAVIALAVGGWYMVPSAVDVAGANVNKNTQPPPEKIAPESKPETGTSAVAAKEETPRGDVIVDKDLELKPVKASAKTARSMDTKPVRNAPKNTSRPIEAKRQNAPRLNDFEDEDDNTIRLGDLLAEIDTRDE
ncbi:MAG: hypothetical protein HOP17_13175 [Acidobacteria bacterium]|nr:hypothetical protein [Acidobacteriota bacterium]